MKKIYILRTTNADSRTAVGETSKETLLEQSKLHITDVQHCMNFLLSNAKKQADKHDYTKIEYIDQFHDDFTKYKGADFKNATWFPIHVNSERHHLTDRVPDDVNMIDVIERICDIVCAGMARSGNIYPGELDGEILAKAYQNTINMCKENIVIVDDICPEITDYIYKKTLIDEINDNTYYQTDAQVEIFLKLFFDFGNKSIEEAKAKYPEYTESDIENAITQIINLSAGGIY